MPAYHVASDIGGTFTDTVVFDDRGQVGRYKAATVPAAPATGVLESLRAAARDRDLGLADFLGRVQTFAHGTTIATNALLEGKTVPVGLIQTRGFGDTLAIMRGFKSQGLDEEQIKQFRSLVKQPPVVPRRLIAEVTERVDYAGRIVCPLAEDDVRRAVDRLGEAGAEAYAVSLLWSFKNPAHEERVAALIEELLPGADVTLSSSFLPRIGEYGRTLTTAVNASLRPLLRTSLDSFAGVLAEAGLRTDPLLMQSNGGLAIFAEVEKRAAATVLSGPVGGVIASKVLGEREDIANIVTTDMGGTSFDVGLVLDGRPTMANTTAIGRNRLALPSVAVRAVGAGAGSIASVTNGVLQVGPESAGAQPGPACYDRGGERPTVADADLVLGYLNPDNFLDGRMRLNTERAREAIRRHVAEPAGLSVEDAAEGIKTIVDARMADLVRQVTVEQGYDPTDFTVFAYGGAGPLHAFSYGAELGAREIVVPITASVHSAFGIGCSDLTMVEERSLPMQSAPGQTDFAADIEPAAVTAVFTELRELAAANLASAGADPATIDYGYTVEIRFRAQIHVLAIPIEPELSGEFTALAVNAMVDRFVDTYEGRFGKDSAFPDGGVEITTFRVVATAPVASAEMEVGTDARGTAGAPGRRPVYAHRAWSDAVIYTGDHLQPGFEFTGLAIVELPDTTIVVGAGQRARVDAFGNIHLEEA